MIYIYLETLQGGEGMVGGVLGVGSEGKAGDIAIEGLEEGQIRPRCARAERLDVRCKALVQPQLAPPLHGHHVAEPLHCIRLTLQES